MATSGLYGSTSTGTVAPQSGSESVGLYGNNTVFGGSYFEYLIFLDSVSTPATPTGGSWSFVTNTGTPPTGWTNNPPQVPTGKVWISIALVNSKSTATLTWSTPGIFANPAGTGTVTSVAALTLTTAGTDVSSTVSNPTIAPVITLNLPTASATNRGALSAADWSTFNSKGSGTVTSVTGTSPVVSSGGTTPAISMAAATTSTNGYLTSTDWNTFNNKGTVTSVSGTTGRVTSTGGTTPVIDLASGVATPGTTGSASLIPVVTIDTYGRVTSITTAANPQGTVTSVTGTAPVVSSGGATPAISMAAATASTNGYLTSTDWSTFNSKGSGSVTSVAATVPSFLSVAGSPITTSGTLALTYSGTALPVANGGTGATTASGALTSLGAIGSVASADGSVTVSQVGTAVDLSVVTAASTTNVLCQVRNTTGATLTKGTAVYISGATGQIPTVSKALATSDATSAQTLGLITADLTNNTNGYVTVIGLISNIDTSAYTDGAQLYLSGATAGALTATKQYAPIHLVYMAVVEHAHPTQGKLFVKVQNGYELDEIHNVSAQTPSNGQTIIWNASTSLWVAANISAGTGISVTNGAGSITVANTGVTSVTGTSPVTSSGGTTPAISLAASYGDTQNPYASKTANYVLAAPNGSAGVPTFRAIVAADIPTLNQNTTGTAANVTGTVAIANGGSGQTTAQSAMNAFAGAVTSGSYLRGNGTNVVMATIQAADVPTLNQNTTGSAGSVANALTSGTGISFSSGTTYNGSAAITVSNSLPMVYPGSGIPNSTGTAWGTSYSTTGSGTVLALATSPSFTTPILGTPTSGNFSTGSFTWPTFNQNTTGNAATATSATTATNIAAGANLQIPYNTGSGATSFIAAPTLSSTYLSYNGTGFAWASAAGVGTVTSVAASVPSFLSISGSPITTAGTLAISYSGTALPIANGGTGLTSFTAGQIHFGSFSTSANLFWDNTNAYLGIGTSSPAYKLDITGQGRATTGFAVSTDGSTFTPSGLNAIPNYGVGYITSTSISTLAGFGGMSFYTNQLERLRIGSAGQIGIGGATYGTNGQVLTSSGSGSAPTWTTPTAGTVTSVTGTSPVVSSGGATPAISLAASYGDTQNPYASKTANYVLASPNGTSGVPTFRAIVAADVPTLNQNTTGTASNVTGTVAVVNGGTGTASPALVAGTNVTITGSWPNQTINAGASSGTVTSVAATVPAFLSIAGSPITTSGTLAISYSGTALPIANGGTALTTTPTNGQLLIGNGTNYTLSTLTAGSNITITNTSGAITIASTGGGSGITTGKSIAMAMIFGY